ncbi:membrane-associated phospholipid phosphatase [Cryobacterium sp. MP_M3]|uniref:phosphatase PAP2 family protein n=1 Tax=unclassified Cryobacterium TaxID=2649013 RepID=UPI001A224255|nr:MULTISPECIES: phosphatase PAP2 family protein [unclassified Cryobacterium]MBG6058155.1 membrane-associated phospholipid phosphatase [Cryobacterium sp. MP_M3]
MEMQKAPATAAQPGAKRVSYRWPLISGLVTLGLALALGTLISLRENGMPLSIDTEWMTELIENRAPVWDFLALVMDSLGGGLVAILVLPVLISAALLLARRPWAAGYFLTASLLTGGLVQLLKSIFGRARPENVLTNLDFGSFPSGHVANAATMAVVLALLFPRVWVWVAGSVYTVLMMMSRTYLGAHWLTDTVGALFLGIGVAVVLWAPLAARLDGEHTLAGSRPARVSPALRRLHARLIVEARLLEPATRRRLQLVGSGLAGLGALCFTAILLSVLGRNGLTAIDAPVQEWLAAGRSPTLTAVMIGLAIVFGPIALPIILLVVTLTWGIVARHAWRPLVLATAMLTGVVLAQIIGHSVNRHRPPTELMLFGPDPSFSFPSGHVLGASDFVLLTAYLVLSRRWSTRGAVVGFGVAAVCIIAAAVSRVYLGYHWATDALASVSLSLLILGCVIAFDTWRASPVRETAVETADSVR